METNARFGIVAAVCIILMGLSAVAWSEDPVYFADPQIKRQVEITLRISDPTPADMLGLTDLTIILGTVSDITGLEYATNLQTLMLRMCSIGDLTPLSGLTNLEMLDLSENEIVDLSPLSHLTRLRHLDCHHNRIRDLSPLSGLTNLQLLVLYNNQISDLSPLLAMTELRVLELRENPLNEQAYCSDLQAIADNNPRSFPMYSPNRMPPVGVTASKGQLSGSVQVAWEAVCTGIASRHAVMYYQVSRALSANGPASPVCAWQPSLSFDDLTAEAGTKYAYRVRTASSSQGDTAGDYGEPVVGWIPGQPSLAISAGPGGAVVYPGEGAYSAQVGQIVQIRAAPVDENLYSFAGWTGTAVETGLVTDANDASTNVTVDNARSTLKANFLSRMAVIYVDDDAPDDPGPCTSIASDPREDGTSGHPFDTIQEGIDVAAEGATVVVREGAYHECIEFLGRNIIVTGIDPKDSRPAGPFPVIDAKYLGTPVTFKRGEDPNCVLAGFVITRGKGDVAGAIYCVGSDPTIANCLIVGNRASSLQGGIVYCTRSDATFSNCTIADNVAGSEGAGIYMSNSNLVFVNSIVWDNTPRDNLSGGRSEGGSRPRMTYTNMGSHPLAFPGNITAIPHFIQPGRWADPNDPTVTVAAGATGAIWIAGDYHLKSRTGRWDPARGAWTQDYITSRCIDAGDPETPVGDEPEPNGGRINMGAYGGTAEASKSP